MFYLYHSSIFSCVSDQLKLLHLCTVHPWSFPLIAANLISLGSSSNIRIALVLSDGKHLSYLSMSVGNLPLPWTIAVCQYIFIFSPSRTLLSCHVHHILPILCKILNLHPHPNLRVFSGDVVYDNDNCGSYTPSLCCKSAFPILLSSLSNRFNRYICNPIVIIQTNVTNTSNVIVSSITRPLYPICVAICPNEAANGFLEGIQPPYPYLYPYWLFISLRDILCATDFYLCFII